MAVISSESELYSLSHFFSKIINLGLLSRLRDLKGRWVLAVDATSQISSVDLSVIFAGILHKDHGFLPLVASMQVYNPYSHYFGAYSHFIFQNPLDTTTFSKISTILKEVAPCDPTVVMADGDGAIRAAVFPDALIFESFLKTLTKWLWIVLLLLYCGVYDGIFNLVRNYI